MNPIDYWCPDCGVKNCEGDHPTTDMSPISPDSDYNFTIVQTENSIVAEYFTSKRQPSYGLGIRTFDQGVVAFTCPAEIVKNSKIRRATCIQWATQFENL